MNNWKFERNVFFCELIVKHLRNRQLLEFWFLLIFLLVETRMIFKNKCRTRQQQCPFLLHNKKKKVDNTGKNKERLKKKCINTAILKGMAHRAELGLISTIYHEFSRESAKLGALSSRWEEMLKKRVGPWKLRELSVRKTSNMVEWMGFQTTIVILFCVILGVDHRLSHCF